MITSCAYDVFGGVEEAVDMVSVLVITRRLRIVEVVKGINDNQLDFHFLRDNAFDVHARLLPRADAVLAFGKSREVRAQLDKSTIVLNAAHNSRYCLACAEGGDVLLPCAEQLFMAETDSAVLNAFDDRFDIHSDGKTLFRVLDTRNRNRIDRQQCDNTAADVGKCAKTLKVCDPRRHHIACFQGGNIMLKAATLCLFAREQSIFLSVCIRAEIGYGEADGTVDARNHRDIPDIAVADADGSLFPRDDAPHTTQINGKIMSRIAKHRLCFQNASLPRRLAKQARRAEYMQILSGQHTLTLGQIVCHFITSVIFDYRTGYEKFEKNMSNCKSEDSVLY